MTAFHGNLFVRSTDLMALPSVVPENAYGVQMAIEENITTPFVCFQTAVLYTSCGGERRIRVLTLAVPTTTEMPVVFSNVNQTALVDVLSKMGAWEERREWEKWW